MNVYGIEVTIKIIPKLDPGCIPMSAFTRAFEKSAAGGKKSLLRWSATRDRWRSAAPCPRPPRKWRRPTASM